MSTDATPTPATAAAPATGGEVAAPVAAAGPVAAAVVPPSAEVKPAEGATPAVAATPPAAPPAIDIKLPEGFVAGEGLDKFKALAAESGLKPEAAQKVFDLYVAQQTAEAEARDAQRTGWVESLKSDKELGGSNYEKTLSDAGRFMKQFGSDSLRALLGESGLGDHPEMVRMAALAGRALAEDSIAGPKAPAPTPATSDAAFHAALFPTMFPKE